MKGQKDLITCEDNGDDERMKTDGGVQSDF